MIFVLTIIILPVSATTITVDNVGGKDYRSVQDAITLTKKGDIIEIYNSGMKYEESVQIYNKNDIKIIGISTPIMNISSGAGFKLAGDTHNITIDGFDIRCHGPNGKDSAIYVDPGYDDNVTDISIFNCSLYSNGGGGVISPTYNYDCGQRFHMKNLYIYTLGGSVAAQSSGVSIQDATGSTAENLIIYSHMDYGRLPLGQYAYGFSAPDIDLVKDVHIYSCAGPGFSANVINGTINGVYIHDGKYPHNAIQPGGRNSLWENIAIYGENSTWNNNWGGLTTTNCFYTPGTFHSYNLTYRNIYMEDTRADATAFGGHQNNIVFENITILNHTGNGLYLKCVDFISSSYDVHTSNNILVKNATINLNLAKGYTHPIKILSPGTSLYGPAERFDHNEAYKRDQVTFIDINISGNYDTPIGIYNDGAQTYGLNASMYFINCNQNTAGYYALRYPEYVVSATDFYYYATIEAHTENGTPCSNGLLFFETNTTHDDYEDKVPVLNMNYVNASKGHVDEIICSKLDENGKSYLPDNPVWTVVLPYSTQNKLQKKYVSTTIKCTYDGLDSIAIYEPVTGFKDTVTISSDGMKSHTLGNYMGILEAEVNRSFYRPNPLDDTKSPHLSIVAQPLSKRPINMDVSIGRGK